MFRTVTDNMTLLQISYRKMITFGYACPIINIVVWVITAALRYEQTANKRCWFGYNLDKIYWILQGPRLGVIIHNLFFMSGIVRVLMLKLKDNKESDATRTWKGCRATVILMPLLGTTNFLSMTAAPIKSGTVEFASWAFCAYLLRSLQGFIVAVLYCFTNAEVKEVLKHRIEAWRGRNAQNHSVRFRAHTSELECEVFSRDVEQTRWATQQPESPTLAHQRSETHSVDIEMVTLELKADNGNLKTPTHEKKSEISLENGHLKSPTQKESSGNSSDDGHLASHEDCKIAVEDESVDIPIEEKDCEIILTSEILKLPEDIKET
ncbi:calcitonin gene-related peptide type 1 receptor-like [Epargyreus clarus]|uniref:calcitonin gene-related peptide type 1 receptor-like n=1 Tax=Epargyreus clarus TaxID=520877 RepID=UPI003C2EBF49